MRIACEFDAYAKHRTAILVWAPEAACPFVIVLHWLSSVSLHKQSIVHNACDAAVY